MVKELTISNEAIADLEEIWDYVAEDSPINADRFIDKIYGKCLDLTELEGVGRQRNELIKGILSLPFRKYVIFFRRSKNKIEIVRVLRSSRNIESIFKDG